VKMHLGWAVALCLIAVFPRHARSSPPVSAAVPPAERAANASSAVEQSLLDAQHSLNAAFTKHDRGYLKDAIADDFAAIDSSGNTYGKGDLLEYGGGGPGEEKGPKPILYEFKVVILNDNAGVVAYNIVLPGSHPRYLHMSNAWVREDGRWKLKFEQATPNLWSAEDLD
jgi:hypothetical protein